MLQLRLLGSFELRSETGARMAVPGRQSVALLAALAVAEGATMGRAQLAALIWGERGAEQADGSLRQELLRLRRALGDAGLIVSGGPGQAITLAADRIDIDAIRFAAACRANDASATAVALYRGPFLADFPERTRDSFSPFLAVTRKTMADAAIMAMRRMLAGGEGTVALAERALALAPQTEEAYAFLIRHFGALNELARARFWAEAARASFTGAGLAAPASLCALADAVCSEAAAAPFHYFRVQMGISPAWMVPETANDEPTAAPVGGQKLPPDAVPSRPRPILLPEVSNRPSIVVLPVRDLTETIAGGPPIGEVLTEEITASLSRLPGFFVVARHSAMAYAAGGDVRFIARELGVRYLLETGIVQSARDALRCHARLIDGRTGLALWSEAIEARAADRFELRDRIVSETAGRLIPRLLNAEIAAALGAPSQAGGVWAAMMRAQGELLRERPVATAMRAARAHAEDAVRMDPDMAQAHAMAGYTRCHLATMRYSAQPVRDLFRARRHMIKALKNGRDDPTVLGMCANIAMYACFDIDRAVTLCEDAVRLAPNDASAWAELGHIRRVAGDDPRACLGLIAHAERLSPRDPRTALWLHQVAWCHWKLHDLDAMEAAARRGLGLYANIPWLWLALTASLALQGRTEDARQALLVLRGVMPDFTPSRFYWTARWIYGRRFEGDVKQNYRALCDSIARLEGARPAARIDSELTPPRRLAG
jgi:TolB-like protein/DNA-binding SARP family transcriptional activator